MNVEISQDYVPTVDLGQDPNNNKANSFAEKVSDRGHGVRMKIISLEISGRKL